MKKILLLVIAVFFIFTQSWAKHEKGGYISYQYLGKAADTTKSIYKVTIYVYYSCTVNGPRGITLSIYDASSGNRTYTSNINNAESETEVDKTTYSPCLSNPPPICYLVDVYTQTVTLPNDANGYIIGVTTSGHRVGGIVNVYDAGCTDCNQPTQNCYSSCATSLAMWAQIPGKINGVDYHTNSSPTFLFKDTAVICHGEYFEYPFQGIDNIDNDSLSYSFGPGQDGAKVTIPPFPSVTYATGYSSNTPLGNSVTINPATGLISGIAPTTTGEFIIDVFVKEWRNGVLLDSVKKELQIDVNDCSLLSANLQQVYVNCDSLTLTFQNESTASNINQYIWTFGDTASTSNTGTTPIATHTYSKAGDYTLSLYVADTVNGCNNSTTAKVKVYPGFTPNFKVKGSCYQTPIQFADSTYAKYGVINSWNWNFGDPNSASNTATTDTTSHLYGQPQTATVILQVGSSVGCSGSDTQQVVINNKPYIFLPFTDTLICSIDTLPLIAQTNATSYKWSPTTNMLDTTSLTPIVHNLNDTTIYTFTAYQNGCVGSVNDTVNVLKFISVNFSPDTLHVCKTDSTILNPISQALSYLWSEDDNRMTLNSDSVKNPKASPLNTITTYRVTANLGHCQDSAKLKVYASPYPKVNITGPYPDTTICYGDSVFIRATKTGTYTKWSPTKGLSDSTLLSPVAKPDTTTTYTLSVTDTFYCPKPVSENVLINVVPPFSLTAGNDTAVILGEPLKMYASIIDTSFKYSVSYLWSPVTYLDYPDTADPTITGKLPAQQIIPYTITATTQQGCKGTGHVTVYFYSTRPDIFIPTVFTPTVNSLIAVPVGIANFEYFRVYDRYGQLVFATNNPKRGWDGTFNGVKMDVGTYVFDARGIDYLGMPVTKKGTVVLLR